MKILPTSIRKFAVIVISVYFGALVLIIPGSMLSGALTLNNAGNGLFYGGIVILIFGFLFMRPAGDKRWSGEARSPHMRSDAQFKEWRKQERPIELIAWAIIFAATLIATTGYLLLYVASSSI